MRNLHIKLLFFVCVISLVSTGLVTAQQQPKPNQQGKPNQQNKQNQQSKPNQPPAPSQSQTPPAASPADSAAIQALERIIRNEAALVKRLETLHPLMETYLQNLDKDEQLTFRPTGDEYFIGKLDYSSTAREKTLMKKKRFTSIITSKITQLYSVKYLPGGFAQFLAINADFDRSNYDFEFVRREFLGEVRTLVFDVMPKKDSKGTFKGRIWAEDQDYNVVRFNGTYGASTATKMYFHFDSWREYMGPGLWLPAYVYTEESDMGYLAGARKLRFKGQTRLWGYNVGKSSAQNELTAMLVESDHVKDNVNEAEGISPVRSLRAWERDAEDNIIQRLQKAALIAQPGEVDKVIETVATNLQVTNNLDIQPEVRARVLLTAPLESFTIGNTIVLSRGLIDVLPDEASLAMIVAHELAHIALGHEIDTKYAFSDRMLFEDPEAFRKVQLKRDENEENLADQKAAEFLKNSPYKDKLGNAGLFLKAVNERAPQLDHLLLPHIGNTMSKGGQVQRMTELMQSAPELEMAKLDQIAALPLGSRVRVDAWDAKVELTKAKPVALVNAREKMPFEVAPVHLYLTRPGAQKQATTPATGSQNGAAGAKQ
jgi:hypothetical protein